MPRGQSKWIDIAQIEKSSTAFPDKVIPQSILTCGQREESYLFENFPHNTFKMSYLHGELQIIIDSIQEGWNSKKHIIACCLSSQIITSIGL